MKPQSAKSKGRKFQQWVRDLLIEKLDIHPEDIESRSMGAAGEDIMMARSARNLFPFSIECKTSNLLISGNHMNKLKKILVIMNQLYF